LEIQYESKGNIIVELEKMCCEWDIYAKRIDRPRPKPMALGLEKHPIAIS
jgi:hypothetical protein